MDGSSSLGGPRDKGRFVGRVALVTGGSKGIGRAIATRLAAGGASVAITWFRDRASAETTLADIVRLGARTHAVKAFLGHEETPAAVVEEVRLELGEPDLLVANAASGTQRPLSQIRKLHWDWTMETNAASFLRLVQAARGLRSVIALTSLGATRVLPGYGIVGASKAALEALVRYLSVELAPGCRVNAISAGVVETDSLRKFPRAGEILKEALTRTPAGRLVTPEDVAAAAAFLLSDDAAMITGQTVCVDGGIAVLA